MAESARLRSGPTAMTPRVAAPAPLKRKHLGLRSPRGAANTTPRAATEGTQPRAVPVPPSQPRDAGTSTASARAFRPLIRDGINPSKHRAPVPDELFATLPQEVRPAAALDLCPSAFSATQFLVDNATLPASSAPDPGAEGTGRGGRLACDGRVVQHRADGQDSGVCCIPGFAVQRVAAVTLL